MKKIKNKFKILILLASSVVVSLAIYLATPNFLPKAESYAIGDISVNWGVAEPNPIFTVNNAAPGDSQNRNVIVTNNAPSLRPIGARSVKTAETGNLSSVLEITVAVNGVDAYGGTTGTKTLAQFFTDSAGPDGVFLTNLNQSQTKTINFKIDFPQSAGNAFQNTSVTFNIFIGISIDLPAECDQINLLPTPIIGTSKAETITGTPGNDLIMGLEGADHINSNGGDDCILGGPGADTINGNDGNDVIFGEGGADTIHGNNDNDIISGGTGADSIYGDNGQDQLFGNEDADSLYGGNDNDVLDGGTGADSLKGENGNDILTGGAGIDSASGGAGTDTCTAESKAGCEL
jgi:Ca2+-binding RTX toxin-like protein